MSRTKAAEPTFRRDRLIRLSGMERWHFWFAGRLALLERLLASHGREDALVADVGCGTGWVLEVLTRIGYDVVGLDQRREGLLRVRRALPGAGVAQSGGTRLPWRSGSVGTLVLLDVLEHTDDCALLTEASRVLQPGGAAIIAVPALPWLWSFRDEDAGHLRRYTSRQLRQLVSDSHLFPRVVGYYQFLLLPVLVLTRLLGRRGAALRDIEERPAGMLNKVLSGIHRIEARVSAGGWLPWGSSLFAVGIKE